ncbi:probable receptor-like protein kinase At5g61350 [Durio zibethinus]|uniref:Probable receptor-like protein kinase At5g61350 n=1 Tax=Durio zibethinus TaxID=66656 RepID=A0A6P5ZSK5_DURZI|nr:probable receptor-like protein kinase At5g61350 [Durio zibethinus]
MSDETSSSSGIVLEGIDDVEDYHWANEGVGSLPWDRYSHVYDHVQNGNQAFRENRFEEAINNYSRANNMKPGDPVILGNRSAAYMRISLFLKRRSPTASEYRPLNGLDMTTLAELALKDAERLISLQNDAVRSYILKANALILLERYEIARDIILSGLQLDPFSDILRASLRSLERMPSSLMRTRGHEGPERTDDFDCTLCLKLLYEPITTPCGHSFCRSCLFQSMDRGNKCPLCRTVLFISPRTCAISVTLNNIIQKNFPEEYAERKSEHDSLINLGNDLIPLFVMDVVIPCQKFRLHIFEPRYRLMVRRVMEGNHRMGMGIRDPATDTIADFACEVEITECEPLPDGRFFLEIESRRRFRILRFWDQDGYRMAEVEWVQDIPPTDARDREDLQESTNNAAAFARSWLDTAKEATRDQRRLETLYNVEVMMPNPQDPERFSFWLATLSNRRPSERLELLRIRDTGERIRRGLIYLRLEGRGRRKQMKDNSLRYRLQLCTFVTTCFQQTTFCLTVFLPFCPYKFLVGILSLFPCLCHSPPKNQHVHTITTTVTATLAYRGFWPLPLAMGGDHHRLARPLHVSSLSFFFIFLYLLLLNHSIFVLAKDGDVNQKTSAPAPSPVVSSFSAAFRPSDNYLIDCGSSTETKLDDGRTFKSDSQTSGYLSTSEDVQVSIDSIPSSAFSNSTPSSIQDLYKTARIFLDHSKYTFFISKPGKHWVRLYFYPLPHPQYDLKTAVFTIHTNKFVLLHDFSVTDYSKVVFKEYLVNATEHFSLIFKPKKNSYAFINAIEIVSIPDELLSDSASSVPQGNSVNGLLNYALEVSYRLNMGGPTLTPKNDTLSRTWVPDAPYNEFRQGAEAVSVTASNIKYEPDKRMTQLVAPNLVYATAERMTTEAYAESVAPNFNLTWVMNADASFSYLIRMHFCDIVSKSRNDLYFNVYINGLMGVSGLDLTTKAGDLATAYYTDFVLNATAITNDSIVVQVGPAPDGGLPNAIINGLEVMKMSNIADSLDGLFAIDGSYKGGSSKLKVVAISGLAMGLLAMFFLGIVCIRWKKRPHDWQKRNSFSSWLLPIQGSHTSFLSSKSSSRKSSIFGSRKSKSGYSSFYSNKGFGRFFTLNELKNATQNFDEKTVIGVGGFGKVFLGALEDGIKIAIKRGNQGSEQGINEFQTEIQMLSKLRHRHLVSLIGFCDEESEMILVYEYMANGPLRDHLYGSNKPTLSWKQRLDICIGAARGLHYLHTGAAQGIIHRDVKTTNILLDENFVAKVSDFGLSKAAPMEQGHVSTAVKGSFGYLDPEYFRSQQLTEKSDVYSFGVLLFEVLCARAVICPGLPREQVSLAEWAMQWHRKGMIEKIVDPKIAGSVSEGSLKKFAEAAEKCLAEYGVDRPSMGDVLWNLEYSLQLQEASSQIEPPEDKSNLIVLENPSENDDFIANPAAAARAAAAISDDSDVTVGSQLHFPHVGNVQGR